MLLKPSKKYLPFLAFALVAVSGIGYWWTTAGRFIESTDNAYIKADKTIISSKLPGFLEAGWIEDNQPVASGTELARIDADDYRSNLRLAQSRVEAAMAEMGSVRAQLLLQDSLIHEAESAISADKAALAQARDDVERYTRLTGSGYSSERDLETALVTREAAQAKLEQAEAELDSQKKQKTVLEAKVQQAVANLSANEASLDKATADMEKVTIRAPEEGVIAQRLAQNGEYVGAGTPLFSLVELDTVWVVANFKETQIEHMRPGQPVNIEVDSFPGEAMTGYIESIAPGSGAEFSLLPPQNATGNFTKIVQRIPVKVVIPQGQLLTGQLRPGMSLEVSVDTRQSVIDMDSITTIRNNTFEKQTTNSTVALTDGQQKHG